MGAGRAAQASLPLRAGWHFLSDGVIVFWVAPGSCCWAQGSLREHLVADSGGMSDAYGGGLGRERGSRGASAARRLAAEIIPKWSGASAANTMEYETALKAIMVEGHGPVEGLPLWREQQQVACRKRKKRRGGVVWYCARVGAP